MPSLLWGAAVRTRTLCGLAILLLALSSAALADSDTWAVIVAGHVVVRNTGNGAVNWAYRNHVECINAAARVGGECVTSTHPPASGPERYEWQKIWCGFTYDATGLAYCFDYHGPHYEPQYER